MQSSLGTPLFQANVLNVSPLNINKDIWQERKELQKQPLSLIHARSCDIWRLHMQTASSSRKPTAASPSSGGKKIKIRGHKLILFLSRQPVESKIEFPVRTRCFWSLLSLPAASGEAPQLICLTCCVHVVIRQGWRGWAMTLTGKAAFSLWPCA